jgi:glucose-1-phosphate adenylyltransferase
MSTAAERRFISQLTRRTYAVVLAGGRGSRLKQLTDWRAKPAVPFGGKFRIVDFTLSNCVNSGIRRIGVATQYEAQSLIRHLQRAWSFLDGRFDEFIEIMPAQQNVDETHWYQGTADAVFQNLDVIRRAQPGYILVLSGDHVYKMDYGRMLAAHVASQADLTIGCIEVPLAAAKDFGVMEIDQNKRIVAFTEKPEHPTPLPDQPGFALASMGIYVFNAAFLFEQLVRDSGESKSAHDFGKNIIPHCMKRYRVHAHNFRESCVGEPEKPHYWRDVGTLDAYWEANMDLTMVTPELNLYDEEWPIWTWQEQLPPAKFVFDADKRRGFAVDSLVAGGCIVSGAEVRRSMLFSEVRIHSYAKISDSVILPEVEIGRGAILRRCVIDKGCRIPAQLQIGLNAEAYRKRFYVCEHCVTLVTPDMLGQQVHCIR